MKKKVLFLVALVMVTLMVVTACAPAAAPAAAGSEAPQEAKTEYKGSIAFLQFMNAHPYFQRGKERAIATGNELGYEVFFDGPSETDTPKFVSLIEDYTSKGVDALVVAVSDDTPATALQAARDKGIKVVTWDMDLETTSARDIYSGLGDWAPTTGGPMMEALVKNMGETGQWAIIDGELSMHTAVARREYMIQYAKDNYPGLELVAVEAAGEDVDKAYTIAQNLITAYPDLKGIMSNTSSAFAPAAKVIEEMGKLGQVFVSGETTPDAAKPGFESGATVCAYTWDMADWAEFACRIAVNLVEGVDMPDGKYTGFANFPDATKEGDIMYYYKALYLTPENINDYNW